MPAWKATVGQSFTADAFDQYAATVTLTAWRPQFVVLHHTQLPTLADWHSVSGAQRMQNLENYYRNQMHWSAGPHLFVADDLIWVFTPLNVPGVHSPSWNALSWGVELVGDYDIEAFSPQVKANGISALAALHDLASLAPSSLRFHKDDEKTTHKNCPGKNVIKSEIQDALVRALAARIH
jgi:hypothetical protein